MAAQKGPAFLLKIDISGTKTTIGGLRSTSISMNDEMVDVTSKDSAGNRELLEQGGVQSMSVSGSGIFTDAASEGELKTAYDIAAFETFEIIIPAHGTYTGAFMVTSLEYSGEYNGEVTYSVSLESSGAITYSSS